MTNFLQNAALNKLQEQSKDMLEKLINLLKEIRESQDESTLALISIYNNQKALAKKLKVKLPEPIVKMEVEK